MIVRILTILLAFLSILWFPYSYTLALSFLASLFFAPVGVVVGIVTDLLYAPVLVGSLPVATLHGVVISLVAYVVGRFIRSRIIRL